MDNELVELLVDEYKSMVEQFIPDLAESMEYAEDDNFMREVTADCATDRIYDEEMQRGSSACPEFREAGNRIAEYFFGKP